MTDKFLSAQDLLFLVVSSIILISIYENLDIIRSFVYKFLRTKDKSIDRSSQKSVLLDFYKQTNINSIERYLNMKEVFNFSNVGELKHILNSIKYKNTTLCTILNIGGVFSLAKFTVDSICFVDENNTLSLLMEIYDPNDKFNIKVHNNDGSCSIIDTKNKLKLSYFAPTNDEQCLSVIMLSTE